MTKFAFYTDTHFEGSNPRHRIDDFPRSLVEKQKEVYEIAEAEGCDFVTHGGDWFNCHRVFSYGMIDDSMDIVCGSKLKTYIVIGEHDLYGHNIESYKTSTLAHVVRRCGMMEVLWEPKKVCGVTLFGKHEPDKMADALMVDKNLNDVNVMICHELLTSISAPFDVILTSTLRNTGFDLIVSGDLHAGFSTHQVDGTWFCNPGSIARRATNDADRWPQMAIISIEKGQAPNIEIRRLKCGKPGSEVFGESLADIAKSAESDDASCFTEELLQFEAESTDVHDFVQKAGKKAGLNEKILNYLLKKRVASD